MPQERSERNNIGECRQRQECLQCDGCNLWQHRVCQSGITRQQYRLLVKGDLVAFPWFCHACSLRQAILARSDLLEAESRAETHESMHIDEDHPDLPQDHQDLPEPPREEDFDVSLPVDDVREQPLETSVEQEIPDALDDQTTTYDILPAASKKGGDLLTDSLGYTYCVKRRTTCATSWRCSQRGKGCLAMVNQRGGFYERVPRPHNHSGNPGAHLLCKTRAKVKEAARAQPFQSAMKLVEEALREVDPSEDQELPNVANLQRSASRAREGLRPKHPPVLNFQVDDRHMPEDFLRRDIRVGEERHLIFATGPQLDYLKRAKVWYLDGTFSVVKEPFHQLFSVHSFVRTGETEKQVPLLFVVMSRRQKRDYKAVFKAVLEMLPAPPAVEEAVLDFESAVWSALASVLPDVEVHGCSFHWAQAVYRKVKQIGLQRAYCQQPIIRRYIRELMALPHLPASHIQPAFVHLRDRCPPTSPMLAELLEYFGTNWIDSTRRPPASWSTFKRVVRTNNDVEGWHYRLNNQAPHSRPNLYILVGLLHQEAALLPLQVKLVSQQKVYRRKRTEDRSKEQKLRALWDEYSTPDRVLSTAEYLRRISDLVDHTDN